MSENNKRTTRQNSNKRQTKKEKKKNKILFFLQISFLFIIIMGFIGVGITAGLVRAALKDLPPIDPSQIPMMLDQHSVIYDNKGNLLEKVQSQKGLMRTIVKYEDINENLKDAFLATEDRTFFDHNGFNYRRLVGAVIDGVTTGERIRGTSTISQQLARNVYLPSTKGVRTIDRKIKEAYYAIQIERELLKEQIFEAYLNTIYLGSGAHGVQAAAQIYFSKDAKDLDLVESALIAGITQTPNNHSPFITKEKPDVKEDDYILDDSDDIYTIVFNENCLDRYIDVLYFMKVTGKITESEYEEARNTDLKTKLKPGKFKNTHISSFFTDLVKNEVVDALMEEFDGITTKEEAENMLYTQGLQIHSTLDLDMQTKLENVYANKNNFPKFKQTGNKKDGFGNILNKKNSRKIDLYKQENLISKDKDLIILKNEFKYSDKGDLILLKNKRLDFISRTRKNKQTGKNELVNIEVKVPDSYIDDKDESFVYRGGGVKIPSQYKSYDKNRNLVVDNKFLKEKPNFFRKDSNGNILIAKENYAISSKGVIQPQSSTVIIDYRTGELKAIIGGRNIKGQKQYNRAVKPRQPGSAIKPIAIYTPAIDNDWTAGSIIDDVPHYDHKGNLWPKNWHVKMGKYFGLTPLRKAVQWSSNVIPVIISERIGVSTSIEYLKKMGVSTIVESGARSDMNSSAMALGGMTKGISPLELTAAYGTLANKGVHIKPYSFTKVTNRDGTVILENKPLKNYVINPQAAFIMTDILRSGVEEEGVGRRARLQNMSTAGKTGTTSDNYDAWFVGFTPYYAAGVWIGNDSNIDLGGGSRLSAELWKVIMTEIHKDLPNKEFERPDGIVTRTIDTKSGKLATDLSREAGHARSEYFIKGTEPTEPDDIHVAEVVCGESGKLATDNCPASSIGRQIFIRRPIPYNPEEHNGLVPNDYANELPTDYCDIHQPVSPNYSIDDLPIGSRMLPNGTILLPDGSKLLMDGTIVYPDGTIRHPSNPDTSDEETNTTDTDDSDTDIIDSNND